MPVVLLLAVGLGACTTAPHTAGPMAPATRAGVAPERQPPSAFEAALDRMQQAKAKQLTLAQAWLLALAHDPTWLAATSERAAAETFRAQGRALLLPQIQGGYTRNRIDGLQRQPSRFGGVVESPLKYNATSTFVQLRQPLLDAGRYSAWRWADARADQGDAQWRAARADLATRLSDAWFGLLAARATLQLRQALADSLAQQARAQEALYRHNEGNVIDAQQTRARLDNARADVIAARADLEVARRTLQAIVGTPIGPPERLAAEGLVESGTFPLPPLEPARLVDWLDRARVQNTDVVTDRSKLRVAQADVRRAASRFLPTLSFVASWAKADSENLSTLSQRTNTVAAGLQLNVPLFTGGYNTAQHAQARAQMRQAGHVLDATLEKTLADVTRHYQEVTGGAQRIRALESAVASGELSLDAARKGYQYGQGSNLDILKMQDKLFQSRAQLMSAELGYLHARIALAVTAGEHPQAAFADVTGAFPGGIP